MPKTYTAAGSATAGDVYTASAHNVIVTNVNNFIVPPMCRVYRGAGTAINTATDTFITFPTEEFDTDGMFTATSDTVTIQTAGVYVVSASLVFAANATGVRVINVLKDATVFDLTKVIAAQYGGNAGASTSTIVTATTTTECVVGTTIRVAGYQTSGAGLNVGVTDNQKSTSLSVTWVGRTS